MRITIIIGIIALLLIAGCGSVEKQVNTDEGSNSPTVKVINQAVLSDPISNEPLKISRTLRIIGNNLDPDEIKVPAGSIVELTIDTDVEHVVTFPTLNLEEKLVPKSPVTIMFEASELGEHEFICTSGCETPFTGKIIVE